MPSHKLNIAAQTKNYHELALLVNDALDNVDKHLLETPDIYAGRTAAYWAVQKGSPECLGVMAKAGANLHRACPHIWEIDDPTGYSDGCVVDPSSEDDNLKVHHALNQTTLSYVTRTCCECSNNRRLKLCSGCKLSRYCSQDCQRTNWSIHQLVCKRIQKGGDLVTVHKRFPEPSKTDPGGFEPFDDMKGESVADPGAENQETRACWEYYDIEAKAWIAYPDQLNWSIEYFYKEGDLKRYTFRPGCAEAIDENPVTCVPSTDVSTHSICFSHMIDHHIYTGAGRKIRRRDLEIQPEKKAQTTGGTFSCVPLCGALE